MSKSSSEVCSNFLWFFHGLTRSLGTRTTKRASNPEDSSREHGRHFDSLVVLACFGRVRKIWTQCIQIDSAGINLAAMSPFHKNCRQNNSKPFKTCFATPADTCAESLAKVCSSCVSSTTAFPFQLGIVKSTRHHDCLTCQRPPPHRGVAAVKTAASPASALAHVPCCHTPTNWPMRWPQGRPDCAFAPGQRCSNWFP